MGLSPPANRSRTRCQMTLPVPFRSHPMAMAPPVIAPRKGRSFHKPVGVSARPQAAAGSLQGRMAVSALGPLNPIFWWVPSHIGFLEDWPQRQRATFTFPSTMTRFGPFSAE